MSLESTNGVQQLQQPQKFQVSPREFILRHVRYLPWIIISLAVALFLAKIKLRYAIPIFRTEARLLIKREAPGRTNDKFDDIFSGGSFQNVFNEMQLLKSRPLAARVAKVLNLQYRYYNKGNIRNSLLYNESPVGIEMMSQDSASSIAVTIVVTDNDHFKFEKQEKLYTFGEVINLGGTNFKVIKFLPNVFNLYASNVYILSKGTISDVANEIAGNLKVTLVDNFAQIINLTYESENAAMAGDILNTLMEVYKSSNIEDKRQTRISTLQFIDERLDSLLTKLGMVEKDLAKYI